MKGGVYRILTKKAPGIPPSATTKSKVLISMMIYEP